MAGEVRRLDSLPESDVADDDLTPSANGSSPLKDLEQALTAPIKRKPIELVVPSRPTIRIRYSTLIEGNNVQYWNRRSTNTRGGQEDRDPLKFSCLVLANQSEAFLYSGQEAFDSKGNPINFRNPELQDMVRADRAIDAVRRVYGVDAHVLRTADEVLGAAGYNDQMEREEDPT